MVARTGVPAVERPAHGGPGTTRGELGTWPFYRNLGMLRRSQRCGNLGLAYKGLGLLVALSCLSRGTVLMLVIPINNHTKGN